MSLWPGGAQVSWKPLHLRGGQGGGPNEGRGMGPCMGPPAAPVHDQLRQTTFYEPHRTDIRHITRAWCLALLAVKI